MRDSSRRSMVIYRKWIINGRELELDSVWSFMDAAICALDVIGYKSNKSLVLSSPLRLNDDSDPRKATLEMLTDTELIDRLQTRMCFIGSRPEGPSVVS